jgi:hypothetical protein
VSEKTLAPSLLQSLGGFVCLFVLHLKMQLHQLISLSLLVYEEDCVLLYPIIAYAVLTLLECSLPFIYLSHSTLHSQFSSQVLDQVDSGSDPRLQDLLGRSHSTDTFKRVESKTLME